MEIPSGPRVPPPGAGASPCPEPAAFSPRVTERDTASFELRATACDPPRHNRYRVGVPLPSFGRSRSSKAAPGRRSDTSGPAAAEPTADDPELSSYLAALAPESDLETTGSGRRFGEAQVYQLRLSLAAGQELKDLASQRGTSPQALAQEWVLERLAEETANPYAASQSAPPPARPAAAPMPPHADDSADPTTEELFLDQHQWPGEPVPGRHG